MLTNLAKLRHNISKMLLLGKCQLFEITLNTIETQAAFTWNIFGQAIGVLAMCWR